MHGRMILILCGWAALLAGCATIQKHTVKVDTAPPDALVTVCTQVAGGSGSIKIAGATPIVKELEIGKKDRVWLEIEKRGYTTAKVAVGPDTTDLNVTLTRLTDATGAPVATYAFPQIKKILAVAPEFKVIQRGFSSEAVSDELSQQARKALIQGVQRYFKNRYETAVDTSASNSSRPLRTIWRDVRTRMEFINPVRLKYSALPVMLETASSRSSASGLGRQYNADALLFIAGKENIETKGMLAGKFGMSVIGTANSYAAGYSRAMARGDSYFVYNVITPQFSQGAALEAVLIDCRTGEIFWANKGLWRPIAFDRPAAVDQVLADLFFGLK
jgi:hypothetical protein